jgi:hypothetical protein
MAKKETTCSFCGSPRSGVNMLIAGINGHICDSCANQASKIVQEELTLAPSATSTAFQALNLLSRKRETYPDLPVLLWHSVGTITILLQEII